MSFLKTLAVIVAGFIFATAAHAKRVALVIGNSAYQHVSALPNPANDARAMADKFESLGFDVVEGYDLDQNDLTRQLRTFARAANEAEISAIFYAGHGIQVKGKNYLVPVDAKLNDSFDWEFEVTPIEDFIKQAQRASGASLVFLDACRDNPLPSEVARSLGLNTRSASGRGLAPIEVEDRTSGLAIAFATSPGDVALDGRGDHSPFTEALLKHIGAANTDISVVMNRVTGEVMELTEKAQRPWINASLDGDLILNPVAIQEPQPQVVAAAPVQPQVQTQAARGASTFEEEKFMLELAKDSGDPADYQAYLDLFPQGRFAQIARNAIKRIEDASAPAQPVQQAAVQPVEQEPVAVASVAVPVNDEAKQKVTRSLAAPLSLAVTDPMRMQVADQNTEVLLNLTRDQKKSVQGRLNAIGINVGGVDGSWGRKTRAGIQQWQVQNGLVGTSYLNATQYQLLVANSEIQYQSWLASRPARVSQGGSSRVSSGGTVRRRSSIGDAAAAAIIGLGVGTILRSR